MFPWMANWMLSMLLKQTVAGSMLKEMPQTLQSAIANADQKMLENDIYGDSI